MSTMSRAYRNIVRKWNRTVVVIILLGISSALIMSVYNGIQASNRNTEILIDNAKDDTEDLISNAIFKTQELIDNTENNTEALINRTLNDTEEMIQEIEAYMEEIQDESITQNKLITVTNGSFFQTYTISSQIQENISGFQGVENVVPIISESYYSNTDGMNGTIQRSSESGGFEPGTGSSGRPDRGGGFNRNPADYTVTGIPLNDTIDDLYHLLPLTITEGTTLIESDEGCVIISDYLSEFFNVSCGEVLELDDKNFTVKGTYYSGLDNRTVYMSLTDASLLIGLEMGIVTELQIYTTNISDVANVTTEISFFHPDLRATTYLEMGGRSTEFILSQQQQQIEDLQKQQEEQIIQLRVTQNESITQLELDMEEQVEQFDKDKEFQIQQLNDDNLILEIIGDIILVISVFSACVIMFVLMLYTVKERTREVGTLKALGFQKSTIMIQFMIEGILYGVLGSIFGILISWGSTPLIYSVFLPSSNFGDMLIPTLLISGAVFVLIAFLSTVGSIYPSYMASRLSPVEAMRRE